MENYFSMPFENVRHERLLIIMSFTDEGILWQTGFRNHERKKIRIFASENVLGQKH